MPTPSKASSGSEITASSSQAARSRHKPRPGENGTARALSAACWRRAMRRSIKKENTAGSSSISPTTAPRGKFCCPTTCLKASTASTL